MTGRKRRSVDKKPVELSETMQELNAAIQKNYGGSGMIRASDMKHISHIHTGSFDIDLATFGGLADKSLNQIKGTESSGKSTMALQIAKRAQEKYPDKSVGYIDAEVHADPLWIEKIGLNADQLIIIQELIYAEAYAETFNSLLRTGEISLLVVDSIAMLVPDSEVNRNMEDHAKVAGLATVVGKMCSSIATAKQYCSQKGLHFPMILFLNQQRDKIGGYQPNGIPQKIDNGGKIKDYSSIITLELGKPKKIEQADIKTGVKRACIDEQKFKLTKCKSGAYVLSGEIKKVVANTHPRLPIGTYDESPKVVTFCKKLGLINGGGSKQTCVMFPDQVFAKQVDIALALEADQRTFELCKAVIVAIARKDDGRPMMPRDGWLMGFNEKEIGEVMKRIDDAKAIKEKP